MRERSGLEAHRVTKWKKLIRKWAPAIESIEAHKSMADDEKSRKPKRRKWHEREDERKMRGKGSGRGKTKMDQ